MRFVGTRVACSPSSGTFATTGDDGLTRIWRCKHYRPTPDINQSAPGSEGVSDAATHMIENATDAAEANQEVPYSIVQPQRSDFPWDQESSAEPMNMEQVFAKIYRSMVFQKKPTAQMRSQALSEANNYIRKRDDYMQTESITERQRAMVRYDAHELGP